MLSDSEACQIVTGGDSDGDRALPTIRAGFIPLVDCAILIVAKEKGFARDQGIQLELSRESSWSNIRDRMTIGQLDCAHMLAGMAIASSLELGNPMVRVMAPMALGLNGNAITVSNDLWARMADAGGLSGAEGPTEMGSALAKVVAEERKKGRPPLSFGMVYPYSCHNYELRYWMAASGIHPDRDIRLTVVPPPYMPDYLKDGYIDGFCVGEPWNSIAVYGRVGRIVVAKSELCRFCPDKVLGVRADWAETNPESLDALIRALQGAARWAGAAENRKELSEMLARPEYLGVPAALIVHILSGEIAFAVDSENRRISDYVVFDGMSATYPWPSQALWLYSQMVRWGQVAASDSALQAVMQTYRPDFYRRTGADTAVDLQSKPDFIGPCDFFDGAEFDPAKLDEYIGGFRIHTRKA
jgi:ABC-type nitrate/sulfonate/bicarbonate transport system substrate-binding protein